jgi:hypothetical protein
VQQERETLDGPEELPNPKPMMELEAGKNVWYQAYVLKESLNEAKVRFPRECCRPLPDTCEQAQDRNGTARGCRRGVGQRLSPSLMLSYECHEQPVWDGIDKEDVHLCHSSWTMSHSCMGW